MQAPHGVFSGLRTSSNHMRDASDRKVEEQPTPHRKDEVIDSPLHPSIVYREGCPSPKGWAKSFSTLSVIIQFVHPNPIPLGGC